MKRLALVAGTAALTLVVTWPLARCLGTCLGGSQDPPVSIYFLRWFAHAVTTPGARLLDAGIFAPYAGTLALGEYVPVWAVLAFPAIALTGNPVLGHNVVVLAAYVLAALGATALAARLVGPGGAAALAGLAFAFSPRLLHQAHNIQALAACWLPWLFLALERFVTRPTWLAASALAGVSLVLALSSLSGLAYAAVAAAAVAAAVAWRGDPPLDRAHLVRLVAVGAVAAGLLWLAVAPFRTLAREWQLSRTLAENERYSASPADWLGVPPEHLLHRLAGIGHVVALDREALFPGIATTLLAALGLATGRRHDPPRALWPYLAMTAVTAVLALGPTLETPWGSVPMPYRALYAFAPGFDAIRAPRRFAAFVGLGIALLAAAGAARLLERLPPRGRRVALAGLTTVVLLESAAVPFPGTVRRLDAAALPEVYRWLASMPPATVALELPMGEDWEKVGAAAFHLRRTVNGWSSYTPPHYHAFVAAMTGFPDPRSLALIRGVRPDVVLVDREWLGASRAAMAAASGLRLERAVGRHLVYRVEGPSPPGPAALEAAAGPPVCVTLRNPGPDWVPLYPVRRLRLVVETDQGGIVATARRSLPLDLAPGAAHPECLRLRETSSRMRIRGEIEGAGQRHRFAVSSDGLPRRPVPAP